MTKDTTYIYYYEVSQNFTECSVKTFLVEKEFLQSIEDKYKSFLKNELQKFAESLNKTRTHIGIYNFTIKLPKEKSIIKTKEYLNAIKYLFYVYVFYRDLNKYIIYLDEKNTKEDCLEVKFIRSNFFKEKLNIYEINESLL